MAKKVHVVWEAGGSEDYTAVAKIEEDRHFQDVTGWRLYGADRELIAMIKHHAASFIEVREGES